MQAIWRGAISFGLISIPIRVYSATEERGLRFNMLHADCGGRMRNARSCALCGAENLTMADFERGYEYEKGQYVTIEDDDLDAVPLETLRTIEVVNFVPAEQIDPIYYQRSYYLSPDELGAKPYALLRKALLESDRVAIAKVALRQKEHLATLRVRDDNVIVMETMYWPDEVRPAAFPMLGEQQEIKDRELQMALTLIEQLTEDFDPAAYRDEYREALLKVVEAKISGKEVVTTAEAEEEAPVVDLMEALQASLDSVRKRREEQRRAG